MSENTANNKNVKIPHLILAPIIAIIALICMLVNDIPHLAAYTAAITLLTAWWWASEALPIPITSIFCIALFSISGVLSQKQAAAGLGSHVIALMLGGFIMAKALEATGAHKQIALTILRFVGSRSHKQVMLAFMLSAAFLSMWISNTATCLMLIPIALATLDKLKSGALSTPLILAVCFACSIGGIATLIGTPPNIIFAGVYEEHFGSSFGFLRWLKIGLPIVVIILPIAWLWLSRSVKGSCEVALAERSQWSNAQKRVMSVFALIIFLWIFRNEPFGGWASWLSTPYLSFHSVGDSSIALLGAALMFIIKGKDGTSLISWKQASGIPWGVLLMFASGLTIAKAFHVSELDALIGEQLNNAIKDVPIFVLILALCLFITFITEINSNLATTTLILPILLVTANVSNLRPELLMIPATISASCAFMLPVATAPNAVAYSTGQIRINEMMREGFVLNIVLAFCISILCYFLV